jgi:ABC-type multidrug transport system ATPase subunit
LNNVVTTQDLTKHYGRIRAVDGLNLEIPEKSVFGILGPNGSGKTTTLGMLLDVIIPTSGSYSWFGNQSNTENRRHIGSILETPAFYPYLSAIDNLKIIAEIKLAGYDAIDEVLALVGLYERRHSTFRTFSLGMKQRLALASALLSDPRVMILDEPTNGLDPRGIAEIRDLIRTIAGKGKTIILASHLLDEVQKVCSHFAVLNKGKLLYSGLVNDAGGDEQRIELASDEIHQLYSVLENYPDKKHLEIQDNRIIITLPGKASVAALSSYIYKQGVVPTHLVALHRSLEKQFLDILKESK